MSGADKKFNDDRRIQIGCSFRTHPSYTLAHLKKWFSEWAKLSLDNRSLLVALAISRRPRHTTPAADQLRLGIIMRGIVERVPVKRHQMTPAKGPDDEISAMDPARAARTTPVTTFYALYALGINFTGAMPVCVDRFISHTLTLEAVWKPLLQAVCFMMQSLLKRRKAAPSSLLNHARQVLLAFHRKFDTTNWAQRYDGLYLFEVAFHLKQYDLSLSFLKRLMTQQPGKVNSIQADLLRFYALAANSPMRDSVGLLLDPIIDKMPHAQLSKLAESLVDQGQFALLKKVFAVYVKDIDADMSSQLDRFLSRLMRDRGKKGFGGFERPPSPTASSDEEEDDHKDKPKDKGKGKPKKAPRGGSSKPKPAPSSSADILRRFDDFLASIGVTHGKRKTGGGAGTGGKAIKRGAVPSGLRISHNTKYAHGDKEVSPKAPGSTGAVSRRFGWAMMSPASIIKEAGWQRHAMPGIENKSCVVFYRGIHWLRSGLVREPIEAKVKRLSAPAAAMLSQHLLRTPDPEKAAELARLAEWYATIQTQKVPADITRRYGSSAKYRALVDYVHTYFSNDYTPFEKSAKRGDRQLGLNGVPLKGHPFVCFSESDADHALRYAYGQKTASGSEYHPDRLRPRYQEDGSPTNPRVGEIHVMVMTLEELKKRPHGNVWMNYVRHHYGTNSRIVSERECSFVGEVPAEFVVMSETVSWPSFSGAWNVRHQSAYGLNESDYAFYKTRLSAALTEISMSGDRADYKAFKEKLGARLIKHRRGMLDQKVKHFLKRHRASYTCRSPEGIESPEPPSNDWMSFLRRLHRDEKALLSSMKAGSAKVNPTWRSLGLTAEVRYQIKLLIALGKLESLTLSRGIKDLLTYAATLTFEAPPAGPRGKPSSSKGGGMPSAPSPKPRQDSAPEPFASVRRPEPIAFVRLTTESPLVLNDELKQRLMLLLINKRVPELEHEKLRLIVSKEGLDFWQDWLRSYRDDMGRSVLHHLARFGRMDWYGMVMNKAKDTRISTGIPTTHIDNEGNSPLHLAAAAGHAKMVEKLIRYHPAANSDRLNDAQITPFQLAVKGRHQEVIMVLLARLCDMLLSTAHCKSPFELLKEDEELADKVPHVVALGEMLTVLMTIVSDWDNYFSRLKDTDPRLQSLLKLLSDYKVLYPKYVDLALGYVGKSMVSQGRNLAYLLCRDGCAGSVAAFAELGLTFYGIAYRNRKSFLGVAPLTAAMAGYVSDHKVNVPLRLAYLNIIQGLLKRHPKLVESLGAIDRPKVRRYIREHELKKIEVFKRIRETLRAKRKVDKKRRQHKKKIKVSQLGKLNQAVSSWCQPLDNEVLAAIMASLETYLASDGYAHFRDTVEGFGMNLHNVLNDGNCYFHAVLDQLQQRQPDVLAAIAAVVGAPVTHQHLRQLASGALMHMAMNNELVGFVDSPEHFIAKMATDREWANGQVIAALSRVLGVTMVLINSEGAPVTTINSGQAKKIYLGYQVGVHFQSARGEPSADLLGQISDGTPGELIALAQAHAAYALIDEGGATDMPFESASRKRVKIGRESPVASL